jgi:heterodisulfide reductase subunit A
MDSKHRFEQFDMVVLSVGLDSPKDAEQIAKQFAIELNPFKFCETSPFTPLNTRRKGIYVAGAFQGPKDIPESVTQSSAAAGIAAGMLKQQRGKGYVVKTYPDERDIQEEEVRIGVFTCHCGINIGGVVDVPRVDKYAGNLENVVYHSESMYSCSQDAQEVLKQKIKEHRLNRVVIAACSPRTHEPLFQETLKDAGLNRNLFEMVNIRDQCSWVHANEPGLATNKSMDLIRMGVAKANLIKPLAEQTVPVTPKAIVVGGGVAGITAALTIADQGFHCTLIERQAKLGGNLLDIKKTIMGVDTAKTLASLIEQAENNKLIDICTSSELIETSGFVGNFSSVVSIKKGKKTIEQTIDHGVIVLATGGREHQPKTVLGKEPVNAKNILTQKQLETQLTGSGKSKAPKSVVMVQCAGSRGDDLNYCSKVCCNHAVKNALTIKEMDPQSQIIVLYRDMRTYGYAEEKYREAREKGVVFVPYEVDDMPQIAKKGSTAHITYNDPILQEKVTIEPEIIALSVGIVPEDTSVMSKLLKVPVTADNFFLEAHVKLRPVEMPVDGVYVCGLAHAPKPLDETIVQAQAAAAKAAMPLVKGEVSVEPIVSCVDPEYCIGCGLCESLCPYKAIVMIKDENNKRKAQTIMASCKACGICSSHCPTFAISMGGFTNEQITSQIEAFGKIIEE